MLLIWLHALSFSAVIGMVLFMGLVLLPALNRAEDFQNQVQVMREVMRIYNPIFFTFLGIALMSGGIGLTDFKIRVGVQYFQQFATIIGLKLLLVFLVILVSCFQSFAIGLKFVRHWEEMAGDEMLLRKAVNRLQFTFQLNAVLLGAILLLGLLMRR